MGKEYSLRITSVVSVPLAGGGDIIESQTLVKIPLKSPIDPKNYEDIIGIVESLLEVLKAQQKADKVAF